MRVILQITNGPQKGRKVLLGSERVLQIGRSEWAELVCEDDPKMSRVHCKVETNLVGCSVEDVGSSNGTFVNDEKIAQKTLLKSGDQFRAGQTVFSVEIEGGQHKEAETLNQQEVKAVHELREARNSARLSAERAAVLTGEKEIGYRVATAENGLAIFTPSQPPEHQAAVVAARVASLLAETSPLFMLVHPLKIPNASAEDFPEGEPLFDYMPEEVARERSPLLISADAVYDIPELFEKAWGHNAMVTMVALAGFEELLAQFRSAARPEGDDGLLGICWPNVLSGLLTSGDRDLFHSQLADVQAVMLEDASADNAWKIIADSSFADLLNGVGIKKSSAK